MVHTVRRKVKGGKLLQVQLEQDGSFVTLVTITGDFFIHPEEGLNLLEKGLVGVPVQEDVVRLSKRVEVIIKENGLTVLGFSPPDLAASIREALS